MYDMPKPSSTTPGAPPFGINLYGYLTSRLGLGVAARNTARMLIANGVPVRLADVNPGGGMRGQEHEFDELIAESASMPAYAVNLFHVNPDQVLYLLNPLTRTVTLENRLNVCVPFWELPRLPRSWVEPLRAMDLILAPTHYVMDTLLADLPDAKVAHYPQAVHVPYGIAADRAASGLPDDAVVFVASFDMRSDIERKNPWGAIEAFGQAFPGRDDVRLVIKVNNVGTAAGHAPHLARLKAAAADARVTILDRPMPYHEILALYASSDVLVSLHRAEGLGLSLLEAMALGKPVVATAWSGNMDFMTSENSCPVGFEMVDVVASTQPAYGKGASSAQHWAEPRIAEAVKHLRSLADDEELRTSLGARAREDAARIAASYDSGAGLKPAWRLYDEWTATGALATPASRRMQALRRRFFWFYSRRIVRAVSYRARARLSRA